MTRRLLRLAMLAALFVVAVPVSAFAQTGTIVDWGPDSYSYETSYTAAFVSNPGSVLRVVGIVNDFAGPLSVLEPIPAGTEYTFYIEGLISLGTVITPGISINTYKTDYIGQPARISIYRDTPADAAFGVNPPNATAPASFIDGALVLVGNFEKLTVTFGRLVSNGTVLGGNADSGDPPNGTWVGGSALPLVSAGGHPCPFRVTGGWLARPGNFPTGYTANFDGKIDIDCPTPAQSSTWGRIKGTYRD